MSFLDFSSYHGSGRDTVSTVVNITFEISYKALTLVVRRDYSSSMFAFPGKYRTAICMVLV